MARILVVEDEAELREIITLELNDVGHETREAANGKEALEQAVDYKPEIIVSDITMPVMNGYQFFRNLREKHPDLSHTPFIFLSALAEKNDVLKGYRLGADDYISKPIDFELLVARIDARLRLAVERAVASSDVDDLVADADTGQDEPLASEEETAPLPSPDTLVAAKVQTVSLDDIRKHCGDSWSEVSGKILRHAEQVIRSHLRYDDAFDQVGSSDFVITFANPNAEVAAHKIQTIKDEIWDRLFGETNDETLSNVRSELHDLKVSEEERVRDEGFFGRIFEKIKEAGSLMSQTSKDKIKKIFESEDLIFYEIQANSEKKANIMKVDFSSPVNVQIDNILNHETFELSFLSELNKSFLERSVRKISSNCQKLIMLPLRFSMTIDDNRKFIENFFASLDNKLQENLIIERTHLPNRLRSVSDGMRPFAFGRKIQIAELRNPSQIKDFELRKSRVGIISMNFDDVVYHYAKGLKGNVNEFRKLGGRFYIKNVPKGRISAAQKYEPDLIGSKF